MDESGRTAIGAALEEYRSQPSPLEGKRSIVFKLVSTLEGPASEQEIHRVRATMSLPQELQDLWDLCRGARLFEDVEYGQWGLELLPPEESLQVTIRERQNFPEDYLPDDVVFGSFIGDAELLVYSPVEVGERRVIATTFPDSRADWPGVGSSLSEFLRRYFAGDGAKYWEPVSSE
jgi:hypothetical protein